MEHASTAYACVCGGRASVHVVTCMCHDVAVACHCPFQETGTVLCTHVKVFTFASPLHTWQDIACTSSLGLVCPQLARGGEEESE